MARFKDFGAPIDIDKVEPLTFKLYEEEFSCYPEIQGKVVLELASLSESDDSAENANAILKFFSRVMLPESHARFEELTGDPKRIVSVTVLTEILQWLVEEYTNRPTQGSEHSPTGA
jgi:hypothetical protein